MNEQPSVANGISKSASPAYASLITLKSDFEVSLTIHNLGHIGNSLGAHYSDVIMSAMASPITGVSIVCSTVCSGPCRSKKKSKLRATGLCEGIHRWPVDSHHKGPVRRKMFPFDDAIMHF